MNSQLLHINKANCTVSPMSNNNIYVIIELTVKKKLYIKIIIQVLIATFDVQYSSFDHDYIFVDSSTMLTICVLVAMFYTLIGGDKV
jgi:hypothetical protein